MLPTNAGIDPRPAPQGYGSRAKRGQKYCQQPTEGGLIRAHEQLGMELKAHNLCLLLCVSEVCNKTVGLITQKTNRYMEKLNSSNRN